MLGLVLFWKVGAGFHAQDMEDLTEQEWKSVAAFVGYLKGQRKK